MARVSEDTVDKIIDLIFNDLYNQGVEEPLDDDEVNDITMQVWRKFNYLQGNLSFHEYEHLCDSAR